MRGVGEGERLRQQVDNAARPEAPSAAVMEIDLCFKIPSTVHVNTTMKQGMNIGHVNTSKVNT